MNLSTKPTVNFNNLNLASDLVFEVFHAAIMAVLVHLLVVRSLWEPVSYPHPQFSGYTDPRQNPAVPVWVTPPAQFPDQWEFTGRPQQQILYPAIVQPQGNQNPQMLPEMTPPLGGG